MFFFFLLFVWQVLLWTIILPTFSQMGINIILCALCFPCQSTDKTCKEDSFVRNDRNLDINYENTKIKVLTVISKNNCFKKFTLFWWYVACVSLQIRQVRLSVTWLIFINYFVKRKIWTVKINNWFFLHSLCYNPSLNTFAYKVLTILMDYNSIISRFNSSSVLLILDWWYIVSFHFNYVFVRL